MTRDEHLRVIYIVNSVTRGKRQGLLMLCGGPECGGAEMFVPGRSAWDVATVSAAHLNDTYPDQLT